ncbi:MAG: vitamin K epoxide reductase family protein [Rhodoluna sp.]|jgi:uncharacterized membrane protein
MSELKMAEKGLAAPKSLAIVMIVGGIIGWIGAFALTLERFHVAENPDDALSCDINVFISCKSVMLTWQAKLLGFPNSLIGIAAFMAPIIIGFAILAGARFAKWFWRLFWLGNLFGFGFVIWLFSQSLLVINVLCPYCMVAWTGMIPVFWVVTLFAFREDILPMPIRTAPFWDGAYRFAWVWILATYLIIIAAIIIRFWSRWPATLQQLGF